METGILQEILIDDGREILVVCNMFSEYNECYGNVSNRDRNEVGQIKVLNTLYCFNKRKVGNGNEGLDGYTLGYEISEGSEVDNLQCVNTCKDADHGKDHSYRIACKHANDEGNELGHLGAVGSAQCYNYQSNQSTDQGYPDVAGHNECTVTVLGTVGENVVYSGRGQGKTDQRNGGADNCCGHQLVDPGNAHKLYDDRDYNVNESGKCSANQKAKISEAHRSTACKSGAHRADKCEGRAQEYGAAEFGEQLINKSADACTEQCGGDGHTVSYDCGNCDGCCHDGKQLLEGKNKKLIKPRLVVYAVNKIFRHF